MSGETQNQPTVLEVRNLATHFYTRDGVVKAVDGLSFEVKQGEALAIVGESGCGKSVTALSIMRLVQSPPGRIVNGEIFFDGQNLLDLDDEEMRRVRGKKIAMIFQDPMTSLNPVLTIGRQIGEVLTLHEGKSRQQAHKRAVELLRLVGIASPSERLDDYPHQFSGGMRQRVMIAMALACNPHLIIADEPTTALDVTIQAQIIDLVKQLRTDFHSSVIWITHDLGVVAGMCDRVIVMYAGNMVEAAPVRELYANPRHPYTLGLLRSIPRLDLDRNAKLVPIDGLPPDLINMRSGCPFAERCTLTVDLCWRERPRLRSVNSEHTTACWVDARIGGTPRP